MATIQTINIGASANDNTGDPLRTAFDKTNQNNTALNNDLATKAPLANPTITGTLTTVNDVIINTIRIGKGASNTIGVNDIAFGANALASNLVGNECTAIGAGALQNSLNSTNTAFGAYANSNNINWVNTTAIGYQAQVTGDSQVQLGNSSTTTYVYGTVQNRSDLRDKADVQDTILGLDFISKLRPVDYKWNLREDYKSEFPVQGELSNEDFKVIMDLWIEENKLVNLENDGSKKRNRFHHGFIAQEVRDLGVDFGGFQDHSKNGGEDVLSIGYDEFIAPMIKAIQELKAEIELLKSK